MQCNVNSFCLVAALFLVWWLISILQNGIMLTTFLASESESQSAVCNSLWPHGLYSQWDSPGQNTGVGSRSLLQGIFSTQGLNPESPALQVDSLPASHKGSSRILEWVVYPFSSRSSQPRNWTGVSGIAGLFFTNWAIREARHIPGNWVKK